MSENRPGTYQLVGALGVLGALVGVAIYGWGWGALTGTTPYAVGIACVLLAVAWAVYERLSAGRDRS